MRRVYVVANSQRKPGVEKILKKLLPWLKKSAEIADVDGNSENDLSKISADFILVFGGDGSILSVARRLRGNPIPVMGINMGQLGFLAETSPEDVRKILPAVLKGDYVLSKRMMLRAQIQAAPNPKSKIQNPKSEYFALNDAVLLRMPMASMMSVRVTVSKEEISTYKGDGLIVSTATGSTGYNLSAGGPILSERLKALIVTPICPHTLASRPIVVSGDEKLEICAETRGGSPVELVMDGQTNVSLASGTKVRIDRARHEFNLVTIGKKGRYEIIRDKLHWAGWIKQK